MNNSLVELASLKPYYQWGWRRVPTIIFIHGFSSDYESHNKIFVRFKRSGYKYYSFNLPGHGDNLISDETQMRVDNYTQLVVQFILDRKLSNIILVGHSMGGAIAVSVNALLPDLIKALILEDPLNKCVFSIGPERIANAFLTKDPETGKRLGLFKWIKNIHQKHASYKGLFRDILASKTTKSIEWAYSQIQDKPTLLMFGKHDAVIPPRESINYICSVASNVKVMIFEKSAHSPHKDEPELYYVQVLKFIKQTTKLIKKQKKTSTK